MPRVISSQSDLSHTKMLEQLASIIESTDDAIIRTDINFLVETWNPGAQRMFGFTSEEMMGRSIVVLVPDDRRDELTLLHHRLRSGEHIDHFESVRMTSEGHRIDVSLSIAPIRSLDGQTVGYSKIARNVTRMRQADAEAKETQRRLSTLMQNVPGAAYRYRNMYDWSIDFISEGCRMLCGYSAAQLVTQKPSWQSLIDRDDQPLAWEQMRTSLLAQKPFRAGYRIRHRSGETRWIWEQGQGVFDDAGNLLAVEGFLADMTELHRTREQLVQSERLAAVGQMLSAIAHESRNALQRIQIGVDMLSFSVEGDEEASTDLARITRAKDDLQVLFEELGSFAAPLVLNCCVGSLSDVWRRAWANLQAVHGPRDAEIVEEIDGVNLVDEFDAVRMGQVFRNLFENSLAAGPDPVRVHVRCCDSVLDGAPALRVSVQDNGPGLSREARQRMFQAFFTTKPKGSGLGMAIANRIASAHRGSIVVGDAIGGGAEFVILLPRTLNQPQHEAAKNRDCGR